MPSARVGHSFSKKARACDVSSAGIMPSSLDNLWNAAISTESHRSVVASSRTEEDLQIFPSDGPEGILGETGYLHYKCASPVPALLQTILLLASLQA